MHPAEFVPARKGGRHHKDHLGMLYYLSKHREKKSYGATAVVDNTTEMIIKISGEHSHDRNLMHGQGAAQRRAEVPGGKLQHRYSEDPHGLPD